MEPSPLVKIPIESFAKGDDLGGFGSLASATQLDQLLRQCSLLLQACEDFGLTDRALLAERATRAGSIIKSMNKINSEIQNTEIDAQFLQLQKHSIGVIQAAQLLTERQAEVLKSTRLLILLLKRHTGTLSPRADVMLKTQFPMEGVSSGSSSPAQYPLMPSPRRVNTTTPTFGSGSSSPAIAAATASQFSAKQLPSALLSFVPPRGSSPASLTSSVSPPPIHQHLQQQQQPIRSPSPQNASAPQLSPVSSSEVTSPPPAPPPPPPSGGVPPPPPPPAGGKIVLKNTPKIATATTTITEPEKEKSDPKPKPQPKSSNLPEISASAVQEANANLKRVENRDRKQIIPDATKPPLSSPLAALYENPKFLSMQKSIAENEERQRVELKERLAREEAERIAADAEKQRRIADPSICLGCGKETASAPEDCLEFQGRLHHRACWRCGVCNCPYSATESFFTIGTEIYCKKDYEKIFSCVLCKQTISGENITLEGKHWHPHCYETQPCVMCTKPLEDAEEQTSSSGAGKTLSSECVIAFDALWHRKCFCCQKCKRVLGDQFVIVGIRPWCIDCNVKAENSVYPPPPKDPSRRLAQTRIIWRQHKTSAGGLTCMRCKLPVLTGLEALGGFWHPECFVCSLCNKQVPANGWSADETNSKLFCRECSRDTRQKKCFNCQQSIVGQYMQVLNQPYHLNCLKCSICKEDLGTQFYEQANKPVCGICFKRKQKP